MRRNATYLATSLVLTLSMIGCAKKTTGMEQSALDDMGVYGMQSASTFPAETLPTYGSPVAMEPATAPTTYPVAVTSVIDAPVGTREHTVVKKDTLFGLARQYYGDASRWKDIYRANAGTISDPNRIRVGDRLVIP